MTPLSDEALEQQIAAAFEADDPAALLAIDRAHALTLPQLERVAQALVELNDELGVDDDDPGPLLARAALLRHGRALAWTFTRGRASYAVGREPRWSILDAIAFAEAWDEGLELTAPVTARLPWPRELAARLALDYATDLLHELRGACDDETRDLLVARLAELRTLAPDDLDRKQHIDRELDALAEKADRSARRSADAAEAAGTDPALNERAYAWEGARIACLAVQRCLAGPHEALGELFELRRQAVYPIHAAEHDRDRWYSRVMAGTMIC
ncbi:hypothetical protein OV090_44685 [Nannocystis sp. RBIL2]|uniref:hypothetical protein n=1 Tax=Nannocystis sp. RBIL2 TaxID=2996788 RepID=UPI00226F636A|nr:hypothetical protein [Nannocystis sp. RBIL2]MCY1071925.1 hypothetical protein [Nannocystis sp. RBIL2]